MQQMEFQPLRKVALTIVQCGCLLNYYCISHTGTAPEQVSTTGPDFVAYYNYGHGLVTSSTTFYKTNGQVHITKHFSGGSNKSRGMMNTPLYYDLWVDGLVIYTCLRSKFIKWHYKPVKREIVMYSGHLAWPLLPVLY